MKIKEVTKKEDWDAFVSVNNGSFLQSFDWGVLKEKEGNNVLRLAVLSKDKVISQAQIIRERLPFSKFYYHIPYGPVGSGGEDLIVKELKKRKPKFIFIEPWNFFEKGSESSFRIEPQKTSIIHLNKDNLFDSFKKSTRYSIRLAEKRGVEIKEEEYTEDFFELLKGVKERQGFSSYPSSYFPLLLETLNSSFFSARYKGKLVAGAIVVFFENKATYLHAVSDYNYRHLSAPTLLQFNICKELQKRGFVEYDLWGIDENKFPGVSYFKKGFSGEEKIYPPSKKIIFSPLWYTTYILGKKIKHYEKLIT